jgi:hypothetical protein
MLERLLDFGTSYQFFNIELLGQLEKSCCPDTKTEVINFDKAKERISETTALHQPKSVDALKILPQLNRIDFIELKGFKMFIKHSNPNHGTGQQVSNQIEKFGLAEKITDSLFVLSLLIRMKQFKCTKIESQQYQQAKKYYLVVVDIDLYENPIKDRLITLDFLSENIATLKNNILEKLNQVVDDIPCSSLENLEKPKLLSCKKIDKYYEDLVGP